MLRNPASSIYWTKACSILKLALLIGSRGSVLFLERLIEGEYLRWSDKEVKVEFNEVGTEVYNTIIQSEDFSINTLDFPNGKYFIILNINYLKDK